MKSLDRFRYIKEFGALFSIQCFAIQKKYKFGHNKNDLNRLNNLRIRKIESEFGTDINKYIRSIKSQTGQIRKYSNKIWMFWYQGDITSNKTLKLCYDSILKNKPENIEIVVVNKENMLEYIDIPKCIIEKVDKGMISLTHLSDIVRFKLLSKWGGTWLDATMFAVNRFDTQQLPFWTIKRENTNVVSCSAGRWTGFAIGGDNTTILFLAMSHFFDIYWEKHNVLIDFFLIDLMIKYLYDNCREIKECMDNVPSNNANVQFLWPKMNEEYAEDEFNRLIGNTSLFKLSYRIPWFEMTKEGKKTNYGHLFDIIYKNE